MNSACAGYQNYLDLGQCYLDLGLNNSGYPAQPHPIIVNNLTCEIIYDNLTIMYKLSLFKDCPVYNKQKNTWVLQEIPDLFLVLNMISHLFAALTREIIQLLYGFHVWMA